MRPEEPTYTMGEIAMATGIRATTLSARRKQRGIPPADKNGGGYTLDQVKIMIKKPPLKRGCNPKKAEQLKARLKNDGLL